MSAIWEGIKQAFVLLVNGDPEVMQITVLSLQISGFATLLSLAACGGGDGGGSSTTPPPTGGGSVTPGTPAVTRVEVSGVAATGAAIANATVTAVNARGDRATATGATALHSAVELANAADQTNRRDRSEE